MSRLLLCSSGLPGSTLALGELLLPEEMQAVLSCNWDNKDSWVWFLGKLRNKDTNTSVSLHRSVELRTWLSLAEHQMGVFTPKLSILPDIFIYQSMTQRQ